MVHFNSIDCIILDNCLPRSLLVLTNVDRLVPCPDVELCHTSSLSRPTPPPTFHTRTKDLQVTIFSYPQSQTHCFVLPLRQPLASPNVAAPLIFYPRLRSDYTSTLVTRIGFGILQTGPASYSRPSGAYSARSLHNSLIRDWRYKLAAFHGCDLVHRSTCR